MKDSSFSAHDVFGYLAGGGFLLASVDIGYFRGVHVASDPGVLQGTLYVWLSYVVGHLVAGLGAWLYERVMVARVVGWPSDALFGQPRQQWLPLKEYGDPLPERLQSLILARSATEAGIDGPGQALFDYCEAAVRSRAGSGTRSASFLALSGFARNVSCAALVSAGVLGVGQLVGDLPANQWGYTAGSLAVGLGLAARYLTLFRRYTREVFMTYATLAAGPIQDDPRSAG